MNQPKAQTRQYWVSDFTITESDIEQIYNYFLEVEQPQPVGQIAEVIIAHRIAETRSRIKQQLTDHRLYQPKDSYEVGDKVVFPALRFAQGEISAIRAGYDPRYGHYDVIAVDVKNKQREFAANLPGDHTLNLEDAGAFDPMEGVDEEELYEAYGSELEKTIASELKERGEFAVIGDQWFVRGLMAEVNVGHMHLAEAVLDMNGGGPLTTEEIMVHLDLDPGLKPSVRLFSLNFAMSQDNRFDEVGPPGQIKWFLKRLEPEAVNEVPERLRFDPRPYDRSLLSPMLLLLERELDDEWAELEPAAASGAVLPTILSLTYPHRWAGTLPLSSRVRPLFPVGTSPRQRVLLVDEHDGTEYPSWVVKDHRYIVGLADWYKENKIPVGGFITLSPGPRAGVVLLDFDRRRPQREWVRLASVQENQLVFELERRSVGCGYDDLMIVGTDYVSALDAIARRFEANNWSLSSILENIFPKLSRLNPQDTVHTKTLYSAVNMVRRVPPGPLFAELIKNPKFQPVGDHYWQLERGR